MKNLAISLLGAAALATTIFLVRQQKGTESGNVRLTTAGQSRSAEISLDRIRELGL